MAGIYGWHCSSCWVISFCGLTKHNSHRPKIITMEKKEDAMEILPSLITALKEKYPKLTWDENLGNPKNSKLTSYGIKATTNSDIYVEAVRSDLLHSYDFTNEDNYGLKQLLGG